jgi:hypothetical protein
MRRHHPLATAHDTIQRRVNTLVSGATLPIRSENYLRTECLNGNAVARGLNLLRLHHDDGALMMNTSRHIHRFARTLHVTQLQNSFNELLQDL